MDATLVAVDEVISVRSEVERLRSRDLTLDTDDEEAFDLRRGGALLDFERVRMVRFDMGKGGSLAFSVRFVGYRVGERLVAPPGAPMDVGTLVPVG